MAAIELTQDNFDKVVDENQLVFIDFWAQWCGPCRAFSSVYEQAATLYPNVCFAKVDIEQEQVLAADFSIRSVPHLMVLKDRVAIYSESGILPLSALKELVEQALKADVSQVER